MSLRMRLSELANRIHTGTDDSDTSRALVVFNLTDKPIDGLAVFHADMSWPVGTPLPPVLVQNTEGTIMPSVITDWQEGPDRKGRADRQQIAFALRFAVESVPPQGWRTYIASYAPGIVSPSLPSLAVEMSDLMVVETLRHGGDLPPTGTVRIANPLPAEAEGGEPRQAR